MFWAVYDRASSFIASLFRSFERYWRVPPRNIVIVTHGLYMRLFVMRYFRWYDFLRDALPENPVLCMTMSLLYMSGGPSDDGFFFLKFFFCLLFF
jgi:hypothetical protein